MEPFYRKEDVDQLAIVNALPGEFPYVRGNKKADNSWFVRQDIVCDCPKEANAKALDIMERGVDSLGFKVPGDKISADYIAQLLEGIYCDCVELNFQTCQRHSVELVKLLDAYFSSKGYDPARITGSISFDPIEKMVMKGKDTSAVLEAAPEMVAALKAYPNFRAVAVNAYKLTNAGAYSYQDLGYALA